MRQLLAILLFAIAACALPMIADAAPGAACSEAPHASVAGLTHSPDAVAQPCRSLQGCNTCLSCAICHLAALADPAVLPRAQAISSDLPSHYEAGYRSVPLDPNFRPPIAG